MKNLNVIGAGRVGRTLASLWAEKRTFSIQHVLDGDLEGARSAVAFIGEGKPVDCLENMAPADLWMLTTPDRHIGTCCSRLAQSALVRPADIVFHCSGSLSSHELSSAAQRGANTASVHPLKTFASASDAVRTFAGTFCAVEGDCAALQVLAPAFERIGARVTAIEANSKTLYHAASVIVCNYVTALIEAGLRCYDRAGIDRNTAAVMIEPMVRETVDNIFRLGSKDALTGPIARGDDAVVARHLEALYAWDSRTAELYRELGHAALMLARTRDDADPQSLARIAAVLDAT